MFLYRKKRRIFTPLFLPPLILNWKGFLSCQVSDVFCIPEPLSQQGDPDLLGPGGNRPTVPAIKYRGVPEIGESAMYFLKGAWNADAGLFDVVKDIYLESAKFMEVLGLFK
jgi:hypothetical protein